MFCSSLRKRPEWVSVPPKLLSQQHPRWKEQVLETHDLAIPLPQRRQQDEKEWFRFLLLSPADMEPSQNHMARIERLYYQTGGRNVGIVFLLRDSSSQDNGTKAFMALQLSLLSTFEMPIVPLPTASSLPTTISLFQRQLVQSRLAARPAQIKPSTDLLPFCSVDGLIPEHAKNILSDICHSIPELARAATTRDGQEGLRQWLAEPSPTVVGRIIEFWEQEYIVE